MEYPRVRRSLLVRRQMSVSTSNKMMIFFPSSYSEGVATVVEFKRMGIFPWRGWKLMQSMRQQSWVPGELFETENAEAMSTLCLVRFPQDLFTLLTLVF